MKKKEVTSLEKDVLFKLKSSIHNLNNSIIKSSLYPGGFYTLGQWTQYVAWRGRGYAFSFPNGQSNY